MAKYTVIGSGYLAKHLKAKLEDYTWYPTEDTEVIFYLGGSTHLNFEKNSSYFSKKEISEIANLLLTGKKIIYPSSALVYERDDKFTDLKNTMEEFVLKNNGIVARIFPVYGREEKTFIGQAIKNMKYGKSPKIYGEGSQTRDFVFVDDVINELINLKDKESGIYDIGTGEMTAFNSIVHLINLELGTNITPEYIEAPKDYTIEGVRSGKPLLVYKPIKEAIKILCKTT